MGNRIKFVSKTLTLVASTAQAIEDGSSGPIMTTKFEMHVPTGATGPVYIGPSNVDATWIPRGKASAAGNEDGTYVFIASENASLSSGDYFDLSKIYVMSATGGDTVIINYWVAG